MPFYFKKPIDVIVKQKHKVPETGETVMRDVGMRKWVYLGFVSPFLSDYILMETTMPKEAIFHTKEELDRVKILLHRHNVREYSIIDANTKQVIETTITNN